jgi:hypothetical protein
VPIIDANPRPEVAGRLTSAEEPAAATTGLAAPTPGSPTSGTPGSPDSDAAPAPPDSDAAPAPALPATVDLRSDGLADTVRHDDDPPLPTRRVPAGEPGRT